jgi:hypothetical protein
MEGRIAGATHTVSYHAGPLSAGVPLANPATRLLFLAGLAALPLEVPAWLPADRAHVRPASDSCPTQADIAVMSTVTRAHAPRPAPRRRLAGLGPAQRERETARRTAYGLRAPSTRYDAARALLRRRIPARAQAAPPLHARAPRGLRVLPR